MFANETYFLEAALRLRLPQSGPSVTPYEPRRIAWEGGSNWPYLTAIRVVVLAREVCPDHSAELLATESLRGFVEAGREPGDLLGRPAQPFAAIGFVWESGPAPRRGRWVDRWPDPVRFLGTRSSNLRPVLGGAARRPPEPVVSPDRPAQADRGARQSPVASATGGQPWSLVEANLGRGKILQWASAADNDWGDWAVQRLYLPVIHQMMGYLTNRLTGSGPVQIAASGPEHMPGIEAKPDGLIVRNVDPSESRIERATLDEVRSSLRLPDADIKSKSNRSQTIEPPEGSLRPGEFWRTVAWVLLIVLVAETFVANRTSA